MTLTCAATALAVALPGASAAPGAGASTRCSRLAAGLVKLTKHYPAGSISPRVNASSTPVCFDFTGDGLGDVAFGILRGGTAGPLHWAVFRGVRTSSKRLSSRYRKVAERFSGSKTRLLRSKSRLAVQNPIYKSDDANCCPTGGATRVYYRVEAARVVKVDSRKLSPDDAGQLPTSRGG